MVLIRLPTIFYIYSKKSTRHLLAYFHIFQVGFRESPSARFPIAVVPIKAKNASLDRLVVYSRYRARYECAVDVSIRKICLQGALTILPKDIIIRVYLVQLRYHNHCQVQESRDKHLSGVSILYDRTNHVDRFYFNGHAFISLIIITPSLHAKAAKRKFRYVAVLIGYFHK